MTMQIQLDTTHYDRFATYNSSGQQVSADSLPTLAVYEQGGSVSLTGGTVTAQGTLYVYQFSATTANGFEAGKSYSAVITATVGGTTHSLPILNFNVTSKTLDTLNDIDGSSVTVTTNNDKTGYSISGTKQTLDSLNDTTAAAAGTDAASKILTTPANTLATNLTGQVESSNMVGTDNANTVEPDNTSITAIKNKTDNIPASPAATGDQMDLVNAPNATAVTALQNGLGTSANQTTIIGYIDTEIADLVSKLTALKTLFDELTEDVSGNRFTSTALSQAPSGSGSFSETEKDDLIADVALVKAKTDLITSDTVVTVSIIDSDNNITLRRGDDYLQSNNRQIDFSNAGWSLTGSTVLLKIKSNKSGTTLDAITATITDATDLYIELPNTVTSTLDTGTDAYAYELELLNSNEKVQTLLDGQISVTGDI